MSRTEKERIEELARLLDGEPTERGSSEAQKLLVLAAAVRDNAPEPARPTPAFRAELRAQLVEQIEASQVSALDRLRDAVWQRTARWRHSAKLATASATASLMLGTAGAAALSQSALPGDLLYDLKQATESVRLTLASGDVETGRLQLELARERLEEIVEGTRGPDRLTASQVIDGLTEMDERTEVGADHLLGAFDRTRVATLLEDLRAFTASQRAELTAAVDDLPLAAVPFADRSFELLRRIDVQAALSSAACDCAGLEGAIDRATRASATTGGVTAPGAGPAAPACDCTDGSTTSSTDDRDLGGTTVPGGIVTDDTTDGSDDGGTDPDGGLLDDSATTDVSNPIGDVVDDVEEPVEELTEPVEEVTDTVEDTVDDLGDAVDDTTGVIDDTTEEVGDLLP